ncbi:MAG: Na+/H+ antiporter subunit D [Pirellulaceae bacterium]
MTIFLVLPIAIPLATMCILLLGQWSPTLQRALGVISAGLLLCAACMLLYVVWYDGIQVLDVGSWPAPFGITLVADLFSAIMVVLAGLMGMAVAVYSTTSVDKSRQAFGFYPLVHLLLMGVCGAFLTGDVFNLYVWFEVMLIASFVLLALGGERAQIEGALKYVTLNLVASALFLAAIGILYAATGTLNMADLAWKLRDVENGQVVTVLATLFLVAFGIKAAVFPLFFWLPASYHTPPVAVSAIFAGLLTKVGVYALIRVFTLLFVSDVPFTHGLLLVVAGLTMVTGVLGAVAQTEVRRVLSFHIVSQIGYMIMGLALYTPLALAGSIFYIIHHIVVKTNLFLISGVVERRCGSGHLAKVGGLYPGHLMLAGVFLISAMSLAGMPPLSGFFAKLTLVRAGLEAEQYLIVAAALVVGFLTLLSMTKLWSEVFWKPPPHAALVTPASEGRSVAAEGRANLSLFMPMLLLAAITVMIGVAAEPMLVLSSRAADQLLNPEGYIKAVLGR